MSLHTHTQTLASTYINTDSCVKPVTTSFGWSPSIFIIFVIFSHSPFFKSSSQKNKVYCIILSIIFSLKASASEKTSMAWMAQRLYSVTSKEVHFGCDGAKSPAIFGFLVHSAMWLWRRVWSLLYLPIFCPHN